jgi:hypothetical protein
VETTGNKRDRSFACRGYIGKDQESGYTDAANTASQNFAHGLNGWGIESDAGATASVQLVSDSTGKSLLFQGTAAQQTFVNSSAFTVKPGSPFTMTMSARVSPASAGSGNFAAIFLVNGLEIEPRMTVPIAPEAAVVATTQTDADGHYNVALPAQTVAGKFQLQARFAGSNTLWPAFAGVPDGDDTDRDDLNCEALKQRSPLQAFACRPRLAASPLVKNPRTLYFRSRTHDVASGMGGTRAVG